MSTCTEKSHSRCVWNWKICKNAMYSWKIYTTGMNFSWPAIVAVVTNFKSASDTIDITAPKTNMTNSGQCRDLPTLFYSRWYKIADPLYKHFAKVTNQKRTRLVAGFLSLCVRDTFWLAGNWSELFFWKRNLVTTLTCSFSFLSSKITKMGSTSFTRGPPLHLVCVKSKSCKVILSIIRVAIELAQVY